MRSIRLASALRARRRPLAVMPLSPAAIGRTYRQRSQVPEPVVLRPYDSSSSSDTGRAARTGSATAGGSRRTAAPHPPACGASIDDVDSNARLHDAFHRHLAPVRVPGGGQGPSIGRGGASSEENAHAVDDGALDHAVATTVLGLHPTVGDGEDSSSGVPTPFGSPRSSTSGALSSDESERRGDGNDDELSRGVGDDR